MTLIWTMPVWTVYLDEVWAQLPFSFYSYFLCWVCIWHTSRTCMLHIPAQCDPLWSISKGFCYHFCTHPSRSAAATPPVFPWSFQLRLVLCADTLPSALRDIHTASGTLCSCCVAFVCVTEVNKTWRIEKLVCVLRGCISGLYHWLDMTLGWPRPLMHRCFHLMYLIPAQTASASLRWLCRKQAPKFKLSPP